MIAYWPVKFGADPELFLKRNGKIIGSERVIPEGGVVDEVFLSNYISKGSYRPAVIRDGVQVELNPLPNTCRESFGENLSYAFRMLRGSLKGTSITPSFAPVVEVSQEELDALSDKSKVLGCAASRNHHDPSATVKVAEGYKKRSAGGHIHLGINHDKHMMANRERLVPLLDILVGNTSVLIDRDPSAAERRLVYGRAGEYRLPPHGLEYRTLSNWWLRSYQTTSLVMGLARIATGILYTDASVGTLAYNYSRRDDKGNYAYSIIPPQTLEKDLLALVDLRAIVQAINTNDMDLAMENYQRIKPFIEEHSKDSDPHGDHVLPLQPGNLTDFEYFVEKGLDHWFITDPLAHWCNQPVHEGTGWEAFLAHTVRPQRLKQEAKNGTR